jgi:hypothetical protein
VLVLASSMDTAADETCRSLTGEADALVLISLSEPPDRRLRAITADGRRPAQVGAISCDTTRGAAAAAGGSRSAGDSAIVTVPSPADLTGIGMHAERLLTRFEGAGRVALCVHSLTTLLQYADTRAVFRFGHALTRKVRETGATAYFHLDPATVDDRTLRTMRSLFDRTVEV